MHPIDISPLALFKCLAQDTRLKTLLLLSEKGPLCVCDLTEALALSQPKISRHLADLRTCQLVTDERRGKWVYYHLNPALPHWVNSVLNTTLNNNSEYLGEALSQLCCAATCD